MKCIRCGYEFPDNGRLRLCHDCVGENTRRQRRPRLTPKELVRGTRWRYKFVHEIEGILDSVHSGGYVHVEIPNQYGEFTWISTVNDFLKAWDQVVPQSDLDREVKKMQHAPLSGQLTMLG